MALDGLFPRYSVHFYREGVYKLVRFNRPLIPHVPGEREGRGEEVPGEKLSQAISVNANMKL